MPLRLEAAEFMVQWQTIEGFDGLYFVSDEGQVRVAERAVMVPRRGVDHRPGRCLKPSVHPNGHLRVTLAAEGKRVGKWVHRLVAEAFIPNPGGLPLVNHIDSDPANNRVGNLEWTTHSGNTRHAYDKGRIELPASKGEDNSQSRLTEPMVREIRAAYRRDPNAAKVARSYGVSPSTVRDICSYRRWAHVE